MTTVIIYITENSHIKGHINISEDVYNEQT